MSPSPFEPSLLIKPLARPPAPRLAEPSVPLPTSSRTQLELQRQRHEAFVSTLAHELRQPLSILTCAIEVLGGPDGSARTTEAVEIMKRQTRHMSRLVEDVIGVARGASGTTTMKRVRLDVREAIAEAATDANAASSARRLELLVAGPAEPLWVNADRDRLRQVLSNLLGNAIKFTEPGGLIRLTAQRIGGGVTIRVSDTGRGLSQSDLACVFDRFFQVRPGEGSGLGLGMSIAHQIVAAHGGRIEARSDGPGRGCEFVVTLPAVKLLK